MVDKLLVFTAARVGRLLVFIATPEPESGMVLEQIEMLQDFIF